MITLNGRNYLHTKEIHISPSAIQTVVGGAHGSVIYVRGSGQWSVMETPEEILKMIQEHKQLLRLQV